MLSWPYVIDQVCSLQSYETSNKSFIADSGRTQHMMSHCRSEELHEDLARPAHSTRQQTCHPPIRLPLVIRYRRRLHIRLLTTSASPCSRLLRLTHHGRAASRSTMSATRPLVGRVRSVDIRSLRHPLDMQLPPQSNLRHHPYTWAACLWAHITRLHHLL